MLGEEYEKIRMCFSVPVRYAQPSKDELRLGYDVVEFGNLRGGFRPYYSEPSVYVNGPKTFGLYLCRRTFAHYPILEIINEKGWRAALYEETLCFDQAYPKAKEELGIAALGSIADDNLSGVPCAPVIFISTNKERVLSAKWVERGWNPRRYRFLVTPLG